MTTKSLLPYFESWNELESRRDRVRKNNELSNVGKMNQFEKIEAQRAQVRDNALEAFQKEYDQQAAAMAANGKARGRALEAGLARFENLRNAIDLEAERVTRMIGNNTSASVMVREWKENRDSPALVLAWRRAFSDVTGLDSGLVGLRGEIEFGIPGYS